MRAPCFREGKQAALGALLVVVILGAVGCGSDKNDPPGHVSGESLLMIEDRVCGFFDPEVLAEVAGDDLVSSGDGLGPANERRTERDSCHVTRRGGGGVVLDAAVTEVPSSLVKSEKATAPSLGPGCVEATDLKSWPVAVLCQDNYGVTARATSTQRSITINLNVPYGEDEKKAANSAVVLLENLNKNVERYDREHPE